MDDGTVGASPAAVAPGQSGKLLAGYGHLDNLGRRYGYLRTP